MNILKNALNHIQTLIQNQKIVIINEKITNINGFANVESVELETIAHIQPISPFEIAKITGSTIDSPSIYRFYFLDDLANVLNSLESKSSLIRWGEKLYRVNAKSDWSQNGWIKVTAHQIEESEVEEVANV